MSVNYLRNPMSMYKNDQANLETDPLISDTMSKTWARLRYGKGYRLALIRRYMRLLVISCTISTLVFSITFCLNINYIIALYSNLFLPTPVEAPVQRRIETMRIVKSTIPPTRGLSSTDAHITYNDFNYLNSETLTYENRTYSNDVHIVFRLPKKRVATALLLIFHGCGRSIYEWVHTIERQRIIGAAIDLGYGCIAFQATDQVNRCWSSETDIFDNEDVQMVLKGLKNFYKEYPKLKSLPRFTFGASSGGIFSSIFVTNQRYTIQGQIIFISIVHPEILGTYVKTKNYPPTAWIYMLRDIEFASEERINVSMRIFAQQKIPYIGFDIEPISLTSKTFHDRIPTIKKVTSHYIFYRLQQNKWLDQENYLIHNPRRDMAWQTFLFTPINRTSETETILNDLKKHEKIISEFLNTIYGEHEINFERSFEALKWHKDIYNNNNNFTM